MSRDSNKLENGLDTQQITSPEMHSQNSSVESAAKRDRSALFRLATVVLAVTFGSNFQIYNASVINNPKDIVTDWINRTFEEVHNQQLSHTDLNIIWSFIAACCHIAAAIGATLTSTVSERLGRKKSLIMLSIINIFGGTLAGMSKVIGSFEAIIVARFMLGISLGLGFGIASMFITEIPPVQYRGASATIQHIMVGLGDFVSLTITLPYLLGTNDLWPLAFAFPAFAGLTQLIVLMFAYESPRFIYLTRKDTQLALKAITFYQGNTDLDEKMKHLENEKRHLDSTDMNKIRLIDLFRHKRYIQPLKLSLAVSISIQAAAIGPVMAYSTDMFLGAGLTEVQAKLATCAVGLTNLLGGLFATFLVEKRGRRFLLLTGLTGCLSMLLAMSGLTLAVEHLNDPSKYISYATIAALLLYQTSLATANSVMWFITSELFGQEARSKATGLVNVIFWATSAVLIFSYLPLQHAVGVGLSFVPFIVCLALLIAYIYFNLPETKNRDIAQISRDFAKQSMSVFPNSMLLPDDEDGWTPNHHVHF